MSTMEEVRKNRRDGKKWVKHRMFDRPSVLAKNLHNYMNDIKKNIKEIEQLIEKKDKEYVKWEGNNRWQVIVRNELMSLYKSRNYLIWLFIRSGVQAAWILADNRCPAMARRCSAGRYRWKLYIWSRVIYIICSNRSGHGICISFAIWKPR